LAFHHAMGIDAKPPASFCVVTRIWNAELPYLQSFVSHYVRLGVSKFYFVNTFHAQLQEVQEHCKLLKSGDAVIEVHNCWYDDGPVNQMQNDVLYMVAEDFVINVDADEFWILPSSIPDLQSLVRRRPADVYWFYWVMVPYDTVNRAPSFPYTGFHGHCTKYMVRNSRLASLQVHEPKLNGGGGKKARHTKCGYALHFWGRSFSDVLLKVVGQKIGNQKTSSKEELLSLMQKGDIPVRLKLLGFFCSQPRPLCFDERQLLDIDCRKEKELLKKSLSPARVLRVWTLYQRFLQRLRQPEVFRCLPVYGSGVNDLELAGELKDVVASSNPRGRKRCQAGMAKKFPAASAKHLSAEPAAKRAKR